MNMVSGVSAAFADTPTDVARAADRAEHLYDTADWYAVEVACGSDPALAWAVADDSNAVAYATLYAARVSDPAWPYARPDLFLREAGVCQTATTELMPSLLLGGRRPGHSSVVFHAAPDERTRRSLAARLMQVATRYAETKGLVNIHVSFTDYATASLLSSGTQNACLRYPSATNWTLSVPGNDFHDWLNSLSRKARYREKAMERKLVDFEFGWRQMNESDVNWIVPLEMAQYRKYGDDYGTERARDLHLAYLDVLRDRAWIVFASDNDGNRVGFASLIQHGEKAWLRQVGMAPQVDGSNLYFGLVYHAVLRWAYEIGIREVDLSVTADDAKRKRGAIGMNRVALSIPLTPTRLEVRRDFVPVFA